MLCATLLGGTRVGPPPPRPAPHRVLWAAAYVQKLMAVSRVMFALMHVRMPRLAVSIPACGLSALGNSRLAHGMLVVDL